jgi:DNA-binding GntR family transcriptional regulator
MMVNLGIGWVGPTGAPGRESRAGDTPEERTDGPLYRRSLGAQIAQRLRDEILLGRIAPDTPIVQQKLSEAYGTSRIPVRDALRQLAHEGFVAMTSGGQALVTRLTTDDVMDTFYTLARAHGRATRRATTLATSHDLARLDSLCEQMAHEIALAGESATIAESNWEFHRQINFLARSEKLLALIRAVSLALPRGYPLDFPGQASEVIRGKAAIVQTMREGNPDLAGSLMEQHVELLGLGVVEDLGRRGLLHPAGMHEAGDQRDSEYGAS